MQHWTVTITGRASLLSPQLTGVYLLFAGDILDYVGQSDHVRRRLMQNHHVYQPEIHQRLAVIHADAYTERLALERYFNQKYNPPNSYIGSKKQSAVFDARFLSLTPAQRRACWIGPGFDEFALPDSSQPEFLNVQIMVPFDRIRLNVLDVPSILSLPPEELFK